MSEPVHSTPVATMTRATVGSRKAGGAPKIASASKLHAASPMSHWTRMVGNQDSTPSAINQKRTNVPKKDMAGHQPPSLVKGALVLSRTRGPLWLRLLLKFDAL